MLGQDKAVFPTWMANVGAFVPISSLQPPSDPATGYASSLQLCARPSSVIQSLDNIVIKETQDENFNSYSDTVRSHGNTAIGQCVGTNHRANGSSWPAPTLCSKKSAREGALIAWLFILFPICEFSVQACFFVFAYFDPNVALIHAILKLEKLSVQVLTGNKPHANWRQRMNLKILVLASSFWGRTRREVGAESQGSLQESVVAVFPNFYLKKTAELPIMPSSRSWKCGSAFFVDDIEKSFLLNQPEALIPQKNVLKPNKLSRVVLKRSKSEIANGPIV